MRHRFWVLRVISELLKVTALAALILGTMGAVLAFGEEFASSVQIGIQPLGISQVPDLFFEIAGIAAFFIGFVTFLVLYGTSQLFYVLIAIEENTRLAQKRPQISVEGTSMLQKPAELAG